MEFGNRLCDLPTREDYDLKIDSPLIKAISQLSNPSPVYTFYTKKCIVFDDAEREIMRKHNDVTDIDHFNQISGYGCPFILPHETGDIAFAALRNMDAFVHNRFLDMGHLPSLYHLILHDEPDICCSGYERQEDVKVSAKAYIQSIAPQYQMFMTQIGIPAKTPSEFCQYYHDMIDRQYEDHNVVWTSKYNPIRVYAPVRDIAINSHYIRVDKNNIVRYTRSSKPILDAGSLDQKTLSTNMMGIQSIFQPHRRIGVHRNYIRLPVIMDIIEFAWAYKKEECHRIFLFNLGFENISKMIFHNYRTHNYFPSNAYQLKCETSSWTDLRHVARQLNRYAFLYTDSAQSLKECFITCVYQIYESMKYMRKYLKREIGHDANKLRYVSQFINYMTEEMSRHNIIEYLTNHYYHSLVALLEREYREVTNGENDNWNKYFLKFQNDADDYKMILERQINISDSLSAIWVEINERAPMLPDKMPLLTTDLTDSELSRFHNELMKAKWYPIHVDPSKYTGKVSYEYQLSDCVSDSELDSEPSEDEYSSESDDDDDDISDAERRANEEYENMVAEDPDAYHSSNRIRRNSDTSSDTSSNQSQHDEFEGIITDPSHPDYDPTIDPHHVDWSDDEAAESDDDDDDVKDVMFKGQDIRTMSYDDRIDPMTNQYLILTPKEAKILRDSFTWDEIKRIVRLCFVYNESVADHFRGEIPKCVIENRDKIDINDPSIVAERQALGIEPFLCEIPDYLIRPRTPTPTTSTTDEMYGLSGAIPNMPQQAIPNMPQGMPRQGVPQGMPLGVPQGIPPMQQPMSQPGMPQMQQPGMLPSIPQNLPQCLTQGMLPKPPQYPRAHQTSNQATPSSVPQNGHPGVLAGLQQQAPPSSSVLGPQTMPTNTPAPVPTVVAPIVSDVSTPDVPTQDTTSAPVNGNGDVQTPSVPHTETTQEPVRNTPATTRQNNQRTRQTTPANNNATRDVREPRDNNGGNRNQRQNEQPTRRQEIFRQLDGLDDATMKRVVDAMVKLAKQPEPVMVNGVPVKSALKKNTTMLTPDEISNYYRHDPSTSKIRQVLFDQFEDNYTNVVSSTTDPKTGEVYKTLQRRNGDISTSMVIDRLTDELVPNSDIINKLFDEIEVNVHKSYPSIAKLSLINNVPMRMEYTLEQQTVAENDISKLNLHPFESRDYFKEIQKQYITKMLGRDYINNLDDGLVCNTGNMLPLLFSMTSGTGQSYRSTVSVDGIAKLYPVVFDKIPKDWDRENPYLVSEVRPEDYHIYRHKSGLLSMLPDPVYLKIAEMRRVHGFDWPNENNVWKSFAIDAYKLFMRAVLKKIMNMGIEAYHTHKLAFINDDEAEQQEQYNKMCFCAKVLGVNDPQMFAMYQFVPYAEDEIHCHFDPFVAFEMHEFDPDNEMHKLVRELFGDIYMALIHGKYSSFTMASVSIRHLCTSGDYRPTAKEIILQPYRHARDGDIISKYRLRKQRVKLGVMYLEEFSKSRAYPVLRGNWPKVENHDEYHTEYINSISVGSARMCRIKYNAIKSKKIHQLEEETLYAKYRQPKRVPIKGNIFTRIFTFISTAIISSWDWMTSDSIYRPDKNPKNNVFVPSPMKRLSKCATQVVIFLGLIFCLTLSAGWLILQIIILVLKSIKLVIVKFMKLSRKCRHHRVRLTEFEYSLTQIPQNSRRSSHSSGHARLRQNPIDITVPRNRL